jgi:uncharacterized protein YjcR
MMQQDEEERKRHMMRRNDEICKCYSGMQKWGAKNLLV